MIARFSARPQRQASAAKPQSDRAAEIIRRFFSVIERLDPRKLRQAPETKARPPRARRIWP